MQKNREQKGMKLVTLFVAQRYFAQPNKQTSINAISNTALFVTALVTTIFVLMLATMQGMETLLHDLFYKPLEPLEIISKTGTRFTPSTDLKEKIYSVPGVDSIAEQCTITTWARLHHQYFLINIQGVSDIWKQSRNTKKWLDERHIPIPNGSKHAKKLDINLYYPKPQQGAGFLPYTRRDVKVWSPYDHFAGPATLLTSIHFVQKLTNPAKQHNSWSIALNKHARSIDQVKSDIKKILPPSLIIISQDKKNEMLKKSISTERFIVYLTLTLVFVLSCFYIFFALSMLLFAKKKEIDVLFAMGMRYSQLVAIFLIYAILVSVKGSFLGGAVGWLLIKLQQKFGLLTLMTLTSTRSIPYPVTIYFHQILGLCCISIFFTSFLSLWPAIQIKKWIIKQ